SRIRMPVCFCGSSAPGSAIAIDRVGITRSSGKGQRVTVDLPIKGAPPPTFTTPTDQSSRARIQASFHAAAKPSAVPQNLHPHIHGNILILTRNSRVISIDGPSRPTSRVMRRSHRPTLVRQVGIRRRTEAIASVKRVYNDPGALGPV